MGVRDRNQLVPQQLDAQSAAVVDQLLDLVTRAPEEIDRELRYGRMSPTASPSSQLPSHGKGGAWEPPAANEQVCCRVYPLPRASWRRRHEQLLQRCACVRRPEDALSPHGACAYDVCVCVCARARASRWIRCCRCWACSRARRAWRTTPSAPCSTRTRRKPCSTCRRCVSTWCLCSSTSWPQTP